MSKKIVCIGAAVQDVFLSGDVFKPKKEGDDLVEEFPLGAKLDLDNIEFSTGGGATNGAVTFARQGFDVEFIGKVGDDPAGMAVIDDLKKESVSFANLVYDQKFATGYSVLLLAPSGERTILTYRGASTHYSVNDFDLEHVTTDWFFVTSLAGSTEIHDQIIKLKREKDFSLAMIPGKGELKKTNWLKTNLKYFDILSLNKEEAQTIVEGESMKELAVNLSKQVKVAVVTDGPNGVAACDGKKIVVAGMYEDVPVIDRTGAGDAFASGFSAMIAKGKSLEDAIVFASANSTSVVSYVGAKKGILKGDQDLHAMPIKVEKIGQN